MNDSSYVYCQPVWATQPGQLSIGTRMSTGDDRATDREETASSV